MDWSWIVAVAGRVTGRRRGVAGVWVRGVRGSSSCARPVKPWSGGGDMGWSRMAQSSTDRHQISTLRSHNGRSPCTVTGSRVIDSFRLSVRRADPVMRLGLFLSVIAGTVDEKHSEEVPTCNTTFPEVGMKRPTRQR